MDKSRNVVLLVNEDGKIIGICDKLEAHKKGLLHKAFSLFIFNGEGKLLLQKRARSKYHSPGLWSNSCCSHNLPGEKDVEAAIRRAREELGVDVSNIRILGSIIYDLDVGNGMREREFDTVLLGFVDRCDVRPNSSEVEEVRWIDLDEVYRDVKENPSKYTPWFKLIMNKFYRRMKKEVKDILGEKSKAASSCE